MPKISSLPSMPKPAVYRRANGNLYLKLNDEWHVKTKLSPDKSTWQGDGTAEEIDPNEEVEVVNK